MMKSNLKNSSILILEQEWSIMRLESALSSSKEGLYVHGQAISVVSDNISNSSTVAYKASRSEFADIMAATGTPTGGITEAGCGATTQCIRTLYEAGTIEETGRTLDFAIAGNGFFLVGDAESPKLTRAGNFQLNSEGYLETTNGYPVLGTKPDSTTLEAINLIQIDLNGTATTQVSIQGNLASTSDITTLPTKAENYTDLNSSASYSASLDVYDSLGASHPVSLYFYKTDNSTWQVQAYVDGEDTGGTAGTPQLIGQTTLKFDGNGQLVEGSTSSITANVTFKDATASNITFDLSGMNQYAMQSSLTDIQNDGNAAGNITGYTVSEEGEIFATLSSGKAVAVATLQLGYVQNEDGLERLSDNLYQITSAAGELMINQPNNGGFGSIEASSLERSTVDLAGEFVDLVVYQRGYQANSSAFSQVSSMLEETISLIR